MSYKTILVHIDDSRRSGARVDFAVDLALKHNAHLIGLYMVCRNELRPLIKSDESLSLAVHEAQARARLARANDHFLSATRLAAATSEWRAPVGPSVLTATLHARHADLIVLGQADPADPAAFIAEHFADDAFTESKGMQRARPNHRPAGQRTKLRQNGFGHHRFHLAGNAGHHEDLAGMLGIVTA